MGKGIVSFMDKAYTPSIDRMERRRRGTLGGRIWANRSTYALLVPGVAATAVFCYWPMYGILLAFKNYRLRDGIWGSAWADDYGFGWFIRLFKDPAFIASLRNTMIISLSRTMISTVVVILLALLLNELRGAVFKRTVQTMIYLPHFLSWVVISSVAFSILSVNGGLFNKMLDKLFNMQPIPVFTNPGAFRPMVYITSIWKEAGFGTIIYLATIAGINQELYESAKMDGANRLKQAWHITLPGMKNTILILFLLGIGGLLSAGFDQVYNLYSPVVYSTGDIIDTFVYRYGIQSGKFSIGGAVGLFKSLISCALVSLSLYIAYKVANYRVF